MCRLMVCQGFVVVKYKQSLNQFMKLNIFL